MAQDRLGEYGYHEIALGVPTVLGGKGVTKIIELPLRSDELSLLKISADELLKTIRHLTQAIN